MHIKSLQIHIGTHTQAHAYSFIIISVCICMWVCRHLCYTKYTYHDTSNEQTTHECVANAQKHPPTDHTYTRVKMAQKQIPDQTATRTMKKIVTLNLIHHCCE